MIRNIKKPVPLRDRSVIITDDGIATGSTLKVGLQWGQSQHPKEIIIAIPVASSSALNELKDQCNDIICLSPPKDFIAVGQYYKDFHQVSDSEMLETIERAISN